jgi:hypothetical protein
MLPACRTNFDEVACTTRRVDQACSRHTSTRHLQSSCLTILDSANHANKNAHYLKTKNGECADKAGDCFDRRLRRHSTQTNDLTRLSNAPSAYARATVFSIRVILKKSPKTCAGRKPVVSSESITVSMKYFVLCN